jgi:hypothetical protein
MWELLDTGAGFVISMPLLMDAHISSVWYVEIMVILSYYARSEVLHPQNADQTLLRFSGFLLSPREILFFILRVPTQSVFFDFRKHANSGKL